MRINKNEDRWTWQNGNVRNILEEIQGIDLAFTQVRQGIASSIHFHSDPAHGFFAVLLNYLGINNVELPFPEQEGYIGDGIFDHLDELVTNLIQIYNPEKKRIEMVDYFPPFRIGGDLHSAFYAYLKGGNLALASTNPSQKGLSQVFVSDDGNVIEMTVGLEEKLVYDEKDAKILLNGIYHFSSAQGRLYGLLDLMK